VTNFFGTTSAPGSRPATLSHLHLFAIGWSYYLLVPALAGRLGLFESSDSFSLMRRFCQPTDPWWPLLLSYVALLPLAFAAGSLTAGSLPRLRALPTPLGRPTAALIPLYAIGLIVTGYGARANFFAGYSPDMDLSVVGPVSTMQMCILFQYLAARAAGLRSARWLALLLLACAVLLLGMGGRLYVLSSIVAIYIQWWKFRAKSARVRIRSLAAVIVTPLLFATAGMLRLGVFDPAELGFYVFAEPLFTSISAFTLMDSHGWSWLDGPRDFFSAFVNLVPAALWPGKADHVVSLLETPLPFEAPFGAVSIVVSTIGNFGFLGGPFFIGFVGFVMERVRRAAGTAAGQALYCYLCALLPFMFFRDPFPVQIKVAMTGFVLVWLNRVLGQVLASLPPSQLLARN